MFRISAHSTKKGDADMKKELLIKSNEKQRKPVFYLIILIGILAVLAVIAHFATGGLFLDVKNMQVIVSNATYPIFISWGMCFLFACGYTDLSHGGVVILGSFATVVLGNKYGYPGMLIGGIATGTLLIFLNFTIFAFTKIPSWIASISIALLYEAIAVFLRLGNSTRDLVYAELNRNYKAMGRFPLNLILIVAGFIIVYTVYNKTSVGLNIRAIGGNKDVSKALGINVVKTLLRVGLICGVLVGFASVLQQSYAGRTQALTGFTSIALLFPPLAIVLLAQVLQKRINIIIAVPICAFIIYAVFNLMTIFGVQAGTLQEVFLGAFIIVFGIVGHRGDKEVVK